MRSQPLALAQTRGVWPNQGCLALLEMWEFREGLVKGAGMEMVPDGVVWWDKMEPWGWRIGDSRRIPCCAALGGTETHHGERKRRRKVWRDP